MHLEGISPQHDGIHIGCIEPSYRVPMHARPTAYEHPHRVPPETEGPQGAHKTSPRVHLGSLVVPSWAPLGSSLDPLGGLLGSPCGGSLGPFLGLQSFPAGPTHGALLWGTPGSQMWFTLQCSGLTQTWLKLTICTTTGPRLHYSDPCRGSGGCSIGIICRCRQQRLG